MTFATTIALTNESSANGLSSHRVIHLHQTLKSRLRPTPTTKTRSGNRVTMNRCWQTSRPQAARSWRAGRSAPSSLDRTTLRLVENYWKCERPPSNIGRRVHPQNDNINLVFSRKCLLKRRGRGVLRGVRGEPSTSSAFIPSAISAFQKKNFSGLPATPPHRWCYQELLPPPLALSHHGGALLAS